MVRKRKRFGIFDSFFDSIFEDFEELFQEESPVTSGGYSISVYQTPEGTIVEANLSEDVDADDFRKMLEQRYPGAKIIIRGGKKSKAIERVDEKESEGGKKVTIKLVDEGEEEVEKEEELRVERDELSNLLGGGRKRVFIRRED